MDPVFATLRAASAKRRPNQRYYSYDSEQLHMIPDHDEYGDGSASFDYDLSPSPYSNQDEFPH